MNTRTILLVILFALPLISSAQTELPKLRFMSYDINPRNPKDITVSINANNRTYFVAIGEKVPSTNWVIKGFQQKSTTGPDGIKQDESEITVEDSVTKQAVTIPIKLNVPVVPAPR